MLILMKFVLLIFRSVVQLFMCCLDHHRLTQSLIRDDCVLCVLPKICTLAVSFRPMIDSGLCLMWYEVNVKLCRLRNVIFL